MKCSTAGSSCCCARHGGYERLRLSQGVVEPGRVLDFLLRDRLFPRSAFASLTLAEECLDQINAGREGRVG